MYLLFYSKHCKYCDKFKSIVDKLGYSSYFQIVIVDKQKGKRHPFVAKYNITEVPTIIVDQRVYVGKEAFKWLESKIKNANTTLPSHDTRQNKIPQITGYASGSFIPDDNAMYCEIGGEQKIETPPEGQNVERPQFILPQDNITGNLKAESNKKQDDAQKKEYEKMEDIRRKQDEMFKKNIPQTF